jgi:hypothetical protein
MQSGSVVSSELSQAGRQAGRQAWRISYKFPLRTPQKYKYNKKGRTARWVAQCAMLKLNLAAFREGDIDVSRGLSCGRKDEDSVSRN